MTIFLKETKMITKIATNVALIVSTILCVLFFSELSNTSGIFYIGGWTLGVLGVSETFRILVKGVR